ncbi:MAG: outer membrane protein heavy metal efflux system [Acidobacteriaceae bacterium]|jgi:cobalt-zinc-cadmium efflux system outer membrane protein|nr:outer membrane protein heavy metal efflux system [Acidobacteriaceae bacterium]MEA2544642.1 outer membrane protein heavy metal efflux system [Acidobacteriaceae bacterium]
MKQTISRTLVPLTVVLAALVLVSPCGFAEDPPVQVLSLRDAITSAINKRPELQAAAQVEASTAQLRRQAGFIPNPRLFYQSENLRPGVDFTQGVDTYAYATEVLEVSGRRGARIATADSAVNRSQLTFEQQKRSIELRVAQTYWDTLRLQYLRLLAEQSVGYYREILDYNEKRFNEGKIAAADLLRVRLEEARAEGNTESSRLAEAEAKQRLAREMGLATAGNWRLSESFELLSEANNPDSADSPQNDRIEVKLAQQAIDTARANLRTQKAQGRPDVDALFGYKRTAGFNTMIAGFQMNLPIFDRNQAAVAAARFEVEANRSTLSAVEHQNASDLALARMSYETWKRQVTDRYRPLLDQAVDIANISRAAYREGGTDLLRLLDAERLRVDTQSAWVEALGNYHQSVLSLEYAEGLEP